MVRCFGRRCFDGLRAGVRDVPGLGGRIIFHVHRLALLGEYALLTVTPLHPDGSHIAAYENDENMYCDKEIIALLSRQALPAKLAR